MSDKIRGFNEYVASVGMMLNDNANSYRSLYESLKYMKAQRLEEVAKLERCIEIVENLKFKPGSVVVHKTLGNGLVLCPYVKDAMDMGYSNSISYDNLVQNFENSVGYVVQFVKMDENTKSFNFIKEVVTENEIMPYDKASATIYGT